VRAVQGAPSSLPLSRRVCLLCVTPCPPAGLAANAQPWHLRAIEVSFSPAQLIKLSAAGCYVNDTALPPRLRTATPTAVPSQCVELIAPNVPQSSGRV